MSTCEIVTVSDILRKYELECFSRLAPRTRKDYVRHLVVLHREFGHLNANELKPKDFGAFLNVKKGPIQRVRQLAVLSAAFTEAVSTWYMIDRNVLRDVRRRKSRPRDRLIGDDEFESMKASSPKRIQLSMMLALLTGQRQGDILSFKWSDITETLVDDPEKPGRQKIALTELNIHQSKTGKRIGIRVSGKLEEVLDECWMLKGGGKDGSEYVLPTRMGKRYTSEGYRAGWQRCMRRWMKRGGENFHFHDIRALAATKCKTPEIAMRLLGHTTLAMTMRVYRRGIERVDALEV